MGMAEYTYTINILFVVNLLKRRGAEEQLFNFMKALPQNLKVSIFSFSDKDCEFPEFMEQRGIDIYSNPYQGTFNVLKFKALYNYLSIRRFDVVITTGLGAALFFGRLCALLRGIGVVYSNLNTMINFHNAPKRKEDYFDLFNKFLNRAIPIIPGKRRFTFMPNSETLAKMVRLQEGRYPIQVLYNGFLVEEFDRSFSHYASSEKIHYILSLIQNNRIIAQVGALDENKNYLFTLNCIKDIKKTISDVRVLIVGDGDMRTQLESRVFENGLQKEVIFTGQLNREECLYLMSRSDLLVLTSKSESFPNVLAEAHALSKPVVTLNVGAASEIVEDGVTGYVIRDNDENIFKERIIKLLSDNNLANTMGENGKRRVFELFSMDRKVQQFLAMMKKDFDFAGKPL